MQLEDAQPTNDVLLPSAKSRACGVAALVILLHEDFGLPPSLPSQPCKCGGKLRDCAGRRTWLHKDPQAHTLIWQTSQVFKAASLVWKVAQGEAGAAPRLSIHGNGKWRHDRLADRASSLTAKSFFIKFAVTSKGKDDRIRRGRIEREGDREAEIAGWCYVIAPWTTVTLLFVLHLHWDPLFPLDHYQAVTRWSCSLGARLACHRPFHKARRQILQTMGRLKRHKKMKFLDPLNQAPEKQLG